MGQWDALGAAAGSGGQFMNAFLQARQASEQKRMMEQQMAEQAKRQAMMDSRYEQEQATKGSQFEQEMALKRMALEQSGADKRMAREAAGEAKKVAKRPGEVTVRNLSEGRLLPGELSNVEKALKENADLFGPVGGRIGANNPYDLRSQNINSQVKATAQMIGKYMEGGVLRAEDIPKYAAMLPGLSDTPETAQNKINNVRALLTRKYNTDLESLQQGGYDVSGFEPLQGQAPTQPQGGFDAASELARIRALKGK